MNSKLARLTYLVAGICLLASAWSFNLATYNWFAADFHNQYSHPYATRGNIFSIVGLAFFVAFLLAIIAIVRSSRKRRMSKP
jgi:TRAP-type C4-dicarboxylate transport system permease small subunit